MLWKVGFGVAALGVATVSLQGCGGGGTGGGSGPGNSTTSPGPTTTTVVQGPVPEQGKMQDFEPTRGVLYVADTSIVGDADASPPKDSMQVGLKQQYFTVRDDLGKILKMGANTVRTLGIGDNTDHDHSDFLDRALKLGLNVIVDYLTVNVCSDDYDCSDRWKEVTSDALTNRGFMKDGKWHPAVKAVMLMSSPTGDVLGGAPDSPTMAQKTKSVISAFDGFLLGEAQAGIQDSHVLVGVSWNYLPGEDLDGKSGDLDYLYGFKNVKAAVHGDGRVGYSLKYSKLEDAYEKRWLNAVEGFSPLPGDVQTYLIDKYVGAGFGGSKLLYTLQKSSDSAVDVAEQLPLFEKTAKDSSFFLGVVVASFQLHQSAEDTTQPMFKNGGTMLTDPSTSIYSNDPQTRKPTPEGGWKWKLPCLEATELAQNVATAWEGEVAGVGLCKSGTAEALDSMTELARAEFV